MCCVRFEDADRHHSRGDDITDHDVQRERRASGPQVRPCFTLLNR